MLYFAKYATLHSTDYDVQHYCLLKKFAFEPSSTSHNVVILHTRLNQLKHRNPIKGSLFPSMEPGLKFIFYRKRSQCSNWKDRKED